MGNLMRQYWLPALLSDELPTPDCPPLRVRLLGENLIAFRDTSGKVGLIRRPLPAPRRLAVLRPQRGGGLRCVYHGWKFDAAGHCIDMPNEPAESNFQDKVACPPTRPRARRHHLGLHGPARAPPPLPDLEANMMASAKPQVRTTMNFYNWMQSIENNMDTSHRRSCTSAP